MTNTKKADTFEPTLKNINDISSTNTIAQRARLLKALMECSYGVTTIQAREYLNVMAPAPRIYELRHLYGYRIETVYSYSEDAQGHKHRNARYVLLPPISKGGQE
ncbi:hypothetical protein A3752_20250 [Oleiphilus sp. HI0081]|nr:hypothetical protein A3749_07335 [Oleiphilus sp. HI0078]KZZ28924.1 hypothetical protein A3752_20250 [Oleiphilus sp. HI0081]